MTVSLLSIPLRLHDLQLHVLVLFTLRFSFLWRNDTIVFVKLTRTLRSEDGDGREKVAEKVNSRPFNLRRDYSKSLTLSNVGEPC